MDFFRVFKPPDLTLPIANVMILNKQVRIACKVNVGEVYPVFFALKTWENAMPEWYFAKLEKGMVRRNPSEQVLFKSEQCESDEYAGTDQLV